ncbi:MAG: hypothetical protein C4523_05525 [Myxococcales bacterium]|nr:MAG: hypothetical protein C4523_05525 [Myxococcales bacterium]
MIFTLGKAVIMAFLQRLFVRAVLAALFICIAVVAQRTYLSYRDFAEVEAAQNTLQSRIDEQRLELRELEEEKQRLMNDFSYYEQLGREEFGMIKKDETVYLVPLP